MGDNGLPVKSPACAYVGSNPTPATQNRRSGPVRAPGLTPVRERFTGPFPVSVGQLWARSGQVSGLCLVRPKFRGGGDCASREPLPSDGCSRRSRRCSRYLPGLAGSGCVSWRVAVCGRLADGIRPGDYRISWASCRPDGVSGGSHRAEVLTVTEGETLQAVGLCV
jgi:hypothetical protein